MSIIGSLDALFFATLAFVGGHFALSSAGLRLPLRQKLGPQGFILTYSLLAGATLLWMIAAYAHAPFVPVWQPPLGLAWASLVLMAPAVLLIVTGVTTRSPTAVGGGEQDGLGAEDPLPGILRVTRHPFLCGTTLWAVAHLLVRGDLASLLLFGGILTLSLGGMAHIDQRREEEMGAAWGPIALTSSRLPFAAIASGRTTMDWAGIGWGRLGLSVAIYLLLIGLHPLLFGTSPLPG